MFISEVLTTYIQKLDKERQALQEKKGRTFGWYLFAPILIGLVSALVTRLPQAFLVGAGFSAVVSFISHMVMIAQPFKEIKDKLKVAILEDLMHTFHPEVEYSYSESKQDVREITRRSGLVSANRYGEEDVIQGKYGDTEFYISEIHLEKKKDKSRRTVFDGLLFRIKLPNRSLPTARIQSRPGLLTKIFGGYEQDHEFGFFYDTNDLRNFREELGALFPFFRHLIQQNKDVRINIEGNEIVMFLNSDMKFLDDPEPRLNEPLLNSEYVENFAQQLNTVLFIVESLASNLNTEEIQERLELKAIEYVKKIDEA